MDAGQTVDDLSKAFAEFAVNEEMDFSKNFKPIIDNAAEFFGMMDMTANCNRDRAEQCVADYIKGNIYSWESCVRYTANCKTQWEAMPYQQRRSLE